MTLPGLNLNSNFCAGPLEAFAMIEQSSESQADHLGLLEGVSLRYAGTWQSPFG